MRALYLKTINLALIFSVVFGCKQALKEDVEYDIGFSVIQTKDKSRIYKPGTDTTDYLHYRPLDIDIWYPAKVSSDDTPIIFRNILGLLEKRANYYTNSQSGNGLTNQMAQYFCDALECSDTTRLLGFRTRSYEDAKPIEGKFPLIIYLSSYNGMGYENISLFEELVKRGFVVASINSIGRYPGDMSMKKEDLNEQVSDALATIEYLEQKENIDFSKIGIVGYSWGGLSASLLASKTQNVKCLISLDGSEFHQYSEAKEEDKDFEETRNSEDFSTMKLSIPYLRLESSSLINSHQVDSVYNFSQKLAKEIMILKVDSAEHHDFSCLPEIVRTSGGCKSNQRFGTITKLTIGFLEQYLKKSNKFSELLKRELNQTVQKK